jgi:hypothetical protein
VNRHFLVTTYLNRWFVELFAFPPCPASLRHKYAELNGIFGIAVQEDLEDNKGKQGEA